MKLPGSPLADSDVATLLRIQRAAEHGETDIHRLVVDPEWHRHGIAQRLVQRVVMSLPSAIVSTGRQNHPARALYEGLGFTHVEDREVIPGLWVSDYRRVQPGSTQE